MKLEKGEDFTEARSPISSLAGCTPPPGTKIHYILFFRKKLQPVTVRNQTGPNIQIVGRHDTTDQMNRHRVTRGENRVVMTRNASTKMASVTNNHSYAKQCYANTQVNGDKCGSSIMQKVNYQEPMNSGKLFKVSYFKRLNTVICLGGGRPSLF